MIRNGDEAPKDWPTEIRQIHDRGEFPILTEDELHKIKAFLEATGGRRRVSYEKQMEDQRTGKQERDQNGRRRLRQIVLFNEGKRSDGEERTKGMTVAKAKGPIDTKDVFLVHGHDDAARETVARFIEKLGFNAIILHEQPNRGRTIIEKFEAHSAVGFAVVLLTPDDVGGSAKTKDTQPRARQNVILELGFFCGALGRTRVCALHKGGVEIPSDFDGVVYVPLDDGGAWRLKLAREMKAAGLDVDMNKAL
jgi:predicted nucleotide-binding protein